MPFSWTNWRHFYGDLWRVQGVRALPEAAFRAVLAVAWQAGWALDRPAEPPRNTVMVVGHQRSGTTWLHRLLADQPGATAMPLHALVLPADSWQSLFRAVDRPAWFDALQDRLFVRMDALHRMRFHEPEEDEFVGWALFRSAMNALDRPWPADTWPDLSGDDVALRVYAQTVAKAARRDNARYVGKNPHFSHRIPELREALPGAHVVRLVRDPAEAIASRLSLIRAIWRRRFEGFDQLAPHHIERIYANSLRCYLAAEGQADLDIAYTDLVADPAEVVARIHTAFQLDEPRAIPDVARTGKTPHVYTLEEFGLDRARLRVDLAPVYERWGFR